jgi:hypothetical protein
MISCYNHWYAFQQILGGVETRMLSISLVLADSYRFLQFFCMAMMSFVLCQKPFGSSDLCMGLVYGWRYKCSMFDLSRPRFLASCSRTLNPEPQLL